MVEKRAYFRPLDIILNYDLILEEEISKGLDKNQKFEFKDPFYFKAEFQFNNLENHSGKENYSISEVIEILKEINFKEKDEHVFFVNYLDKKQILRFYRMRKHDTTGIKEYKIDLFKKEDSFQFLNNSVFI